MLVLKEQKYQKKIFLFKLMNFGYISLIIPY